MEEEQVLFKFRINQKYFMAILDLLKAVNEEAPFKITGEGLKIRAMDPSHVCLLDVDVPRVVFEEYFAPPKEIVCTVNIEELLNVVKRSRGECDITMFYQKNILTIIFKGKQFRKFTIPVTEEGELSRLPDIDQEKYTVFTITSNSFKAALADFSSPRGGDFNAIEFFTTVASSFTMMAQDGDRIVEVRWEENSPDLILPPANFAHATYSLTYLLYIAKASNLSDFIRIAYTNNMPIQFTIEPKQGGTVIYWLAPQIEEEEHPKPNKVKNPCVLCSKEEGVFPYSPEIDTKEEIRVEQVCESCYNKLCGEAENCCLKCGASFDEVERDDAGIIFKTGGRAGFLCVECMDKLVEEEQKKR